MPDNSPDIIPAESIICVDCGGPAHLISFTPEGGQWHVGDVVAYRCRDCLDRWDLVLEADDHIGNDFST